MRLELSHSLRSDGWSPLHIIGSIYGDGWLKTVDLLASQFTTGFMRLETVVGSGWRRLVLHHLQPRDPCPRLCSNQVCLRSTILSNHQTHHHHCIPTRSTVSRGLSPTRGNTCNALNSPFIPDNHVLISACQNDLHPRQDWVN